MEIHIWKFWICKCNPISYNYFGKFIKLSACVSCFICLMQWLCYSIFIDKMQYHNKHLTCSKQRQWTRVTWQTQRLLKFHFSCRFLCVLCTSNCMWEKRNYDSWQLARRSFWSTEISTGNCECRAYPIKALYNTYVIWSWGVTT